MNLTAARYSLTEDVPGVPGVEWIARHRRCAFEHAATMHGQIVRLVQRHGLYTMLLVDVVDLENLHGVGGAWLRRRTRARRAQRILQNYHRVAV
jgi:hypothetical protein